MGSFVDTAVEKLIKRYKTNNPFEIASFKNIRVIFEPLGNIYGYFHTYKRISMIHINSELDDLWRKFVCGHELGHAVLHRQVNTPFLRKNTLFSVDRIEREANDFAVQLLTAGENRVENESAEWFYARVGVPQMMVGKV